MREIPWIDLAIPSDTVIERTITVYDEDSAGVTTLVNLDGCELHFYIRDMTQTEIFTKQLTVSSPASGEGLLHLPASELTVLLSGTIYIYDVRLFDELREQSIIAQGGFSLIS